MLILPSGNPYGLQIVTAMLDGAEQRILCKNPNCPEDVGAIVVEELELACRYCQILFLGGPIRPRNPGETREQNEQALLALKDSWQSLYNVAVVTSAQFYTKAIQVAIKHVTHPEERFFACWRTVMGCDAYDGYIAGPGHMYSKGTGDELEAVRLKGRDVIDLQLHPELIPKDVIHLFAHRFLS